LGESDTGTHEIPTAAGREKALRCRVIFLAAVVSIISACGGELGGGNTDETTSGGESTASGAGGSTGAPSGGTVIDPPPPGQATVSVDGQEFNFEDLGPVTCTVEVGEFGFSFFIGDNGVTLGGGGFYSEGVGWGGSISMFVAGPPEEGEEGNSTYAVALPEVDESTLAFEEKSMSYSGPMQRQFYDPSSESGSGVEEVGTGTVSVTCP
jgi:hypothetical protein